MSSNSPTQTIACPYCSEEIKATAIKCRFCQEFLREPEQDGEAAPVRPRGTGQLRTPTGGLDSPAGGQRTPTGQLRSPTGKLKAEAAVPSVPPMDQKAKLYLGLAVGVPLLLGFLLAPTFNYIVLVVILGGPGFWVLFDSANRYKKPAWVLAMLSPFFWVTPVVYVIRRFTKAPDLVQKGKKRSAGIDGMVPPPTWQAAVVSTFIALLFVMSGSNSRDEQSATSQPPAKVRKSASQPAADTAPAAPVEKPKTYESYRTLLDRFKGMTELQQKKWTDENEWAYWVQGVGTVDQVEESSFMSGIQGDYFEVTVKLSGSDKAVLFYPKEKYEQKVLGMSKGTKIEFAGNLQRLVNTGFWYSGDIRVE